MNKSEVCVEDDSVEALTLTDISSAFYLMSAGLAAAALALLIECIYTRKVFS